MTTESTIQEGMPSYNSQGMQVWDPAVGLYFKPAAVKRESFGGIVGAFQDIQVKNGLIPKSYPENFAGIISAIQDLTLSTAEPPVHPGPDPGNGQIIIDIDGKPEWDVSASLPDGSLWFDTRQGRLFVTIEDQWYQTNGADGLPIVTNSEVSPEVLNPIPGQFWWDSANNNLFIFDGLFEVANGNGFTDDPLAGGRPIWKLITDGLLDAFQTSLTLPLGSVGPKILASNQFTIVPDPDPATFKVQSDYNVWLYEVVKALDEFTYDINQIVMAEVYPGTPKAGSLWYDINALELSIWYIDEDGGQWVPTAAAYSYDEDLAVLNAQLTAEALTRSVAVTDLSQRIEDLKLGNIPDITALEQKVVALEAHVSNHPSSVDLTPYVTTASLQTTVTDLQNKINAVEVSEPAAGTYAPNSDFQLLQTAVSALPTTTEVAASIAAQIPVVSSFVNQAAIDRSINAITTNYLPTTGGTLTGSFVVEKADLSKPAFDFSSEKWYSYNTHKYRSNSSVTNYATFGTNEKPWEYEWDFSAAEDFCWVYNDTSKVFSITKDGPACSQLYLADFQPNDTNGRVLTNTIDVKDRLVKYQSAFETMRQGVSDSTDFDTLKANLLSALASV